MRPLTGKRRRMAKLIRQAHVPIAPFRIHLGSGPDPGYEGQTYYRAGTNTLYWVGPLATRADEDDFLHECGHATEAQNFTWADRDLAKPLLTRDLGRPWFWNRNPFESPIDNEPEPVCELFADAFVDLCRSSRRRPKLRALVLEAAAR